MKYGKLAIVLSFICLLSHPCWAYFQYPELAGLIKQSDVICAGKVETKIELDRKGGLIFIKAWIIPDKIYKGTLPANQKLEVISTEIDSREAKQVEDPMPPFPQKGENVLLFLEKKDGRFFPISPRTGVYKIQEGGALFPFALFSQEDLGK